MNEVFLYRCEKCGTVVALLVDRGTAFYIDQCTACKEWADFEKVKIGRICLYVEGSVDENKERKNR